MVDWVNNNYIEIIGATLAFIYLILEIKRKWAFWIVGILSSAFYVYIFFNARLYAEMCLNFYYIIMCLYGLYCWKFSHKSAEENHGFRRVNIRTILILLLSFFVLFALSVIFLYQFTNSQMIIPDSLIAVLSIMAMWMAAKKIVECWHIWIFVNIFATGLYIHQNLYPTAVLFSVYSILSFVGLKEWLKATNNYDSSVT